MSTEEPMQGPGGEKEDQGEELQCDQPPVKSYFKIISTSVVLVSLIFSMYIFRDYVHAVLLWTEQEPAWVITIIFAALFTLVSLPLAWGYIVINMAAGYLFGVLHGLLVTVLTATSGIVVAHFIIKIFLASYVKKILNSNDYIRALYTVISGPQAFRLVVLARLTPIPFGLQNSVFAVSNLPTSRYILASVLGLLPSQTVNAYIGSTLRSMEEVLTNEDTVRTGWLLLAGQLCISVAVGILVVRRARTELDRTIASEDDKDLECGKG